MDRELSINLNYQRSYRVCLFLIVFLGCFTSLDLILSHIYGGISLKRLIISLIISTIFWLTYYQYFKNLMYSFWGLSLLPFFYFLFNLLSVLRFNDYSFHALAILAMIFIYFTLIYLASTPLLYPKVSWWEFDYRYRNDLPAKIIINDKHQEIRITDIRRKVGSFASFAELNLGQVVPMNFQLKDETFQFYVVIGSKAQKIIGRPYSYGFKFVLDNKNVKKNYRTLSLFWLTRERVRIDRKFKGE